MLAAFLCRVGTSLTPPVYQRDKGCVRIDESEWSQPFVLNGAGTTGMLQVYTPQQHGGARTRYEVVVTSKPEVTLGCAAFRRSMLVVLSPRFIVANQLDEELVFAQARTRATKHGKSFVTLAPFPAAMNRAEAGQHTPFQWHDDSTPSLLCLKLREYDWSGAFDITKVGAFAVKLRSAQSGGNSMLLRVEVKQDPSHGSVWVIVRRESSEFPVYRVTNQTDDTIVFQQAGVGAGRHHPEQLAPHTSTW